MASGYSTATSSYLIDNDAYTFFGLLSPLSHNPVGYLLFIAFLVITAILTDMVAIGSRSRYHGTESAMVCAIYPFAYLLISFIYHASITAYRRHRMHRQPGARPGRGVRTRIRGRRRRLFPRCQEGGPEDEVRRRLRGPGLGEHQGEVQRHRQLRGDQEGAGRLDNIPDRGEGGLKGV